MNTAAASAKAFKVVTELTVVITAAAAAELITLPVQAQTPPVRELNMAQAERFGLTLPCKASAQEIERFRARRDAELRNERATGARAFHAEAYGLTLPQAPARQAVATQRVAGDEAGEG